MTNKEKLINDGTAAETATDRKTKRQERRKNALPPFLMVRAGLLNGLLAAIGAGAVIATAEELAFRDPNGVSWSDVVAVLVIVAAFCYGAVSTEKKYKLLKQDIETIKTEFKSYAKYKEYPLDLAGIVYSSKLAKILIGHIVKNDPGVFDKTINNPDMVMEPETLSNIIDGYVDANPQVAVRVVDTFKPGSIAPEIYNKALKYSNRLKKFEKNM